MLDSMDGFGIGVRVFSISIFFSIFLPSVSCTLLQYLPFLLFMLGRDTLDIIIFKDVEVLEEVG